MLYCQNDLRSHYVLCKSTNDSVVLFEDQADLMNMPENSRQRNSTTACMCDTTWVCGCV